MARKLRHLTQGRGFGSEPQDLTKFDTSEPSKYIISIKKWVMVGEDFKINMLFKIALTKKNLILSTSEKFIAIIMEWNILHETYFLQIVTYLSIEIYRNLLSKNWISTVHSQPSMKQAYPATHVILNYHFQITVSHVLHTWLTNYKITSIYWLNVERSTTPFTKNNCRQNNLNTPLEQILFPIWWWIDTYCIAIFNNIWRKSLSHQDSSWRANRPGQCYWMNQLTHHN